MADKRLIRALGVAWRVFLTYQVSTLIWAVVKRRQVMRKVAQNFDTVYEQAMYEADLNWDAIQVVRGANLGRPIGLSDLDEFHLMAANYRWYYSEHATRGASLQWRAVDLLTAHTKFDQQAYMAELFRYHREGHEGLRRVRKQLLEFGVPEPFLHVTLSATLAPEPST